MILQDSDKKEERRARNKEEIEVTRIITWASADILGRVLDLSLN